MPMNPFVGGGCPTCPIPVGFAGAFAGVSNDALLVAGGANFPQQLPWEGGQKKWYDTVYVARRPTGAWRRGQATPPLGYGVSVSTPHGLICIGGGDAQRHYRDVFSPRLGDGQ